MLDGMFSFVLLNLNTNEFMGARDHIGITPLYLGFGNVGEVSECPMWSVSSSGV